MPTSTPAPSGWRVFSALSVASMITLLVACGGGGGDDEATAEAPTSSHGVNQNGAPDQTKSASGSLVGTQPAAQNGTQPAPSQQASGQAGTAVSGQAKYSGLRGFANHGNTCAISSLMQVLMHDEGLRQQAHTTHPDAGFDRLHQAYIDDTVDTDTFNTLYRDTALAYIQQRHRPREQPGQILDVSEVWGADNYGLGLELHPIFDWSEFAAARSAGARVIGFGLHAPGGTHYTDISGYASYADLPEQDKLSALVVNTGGHFVSYVHIGTQWWYFSDSHLSRVSDEQVRGIRTCGRQGIVFAVYQP